MNPKTFSKIAERGTGILPPSLAHPSPNQNLAVYTEELTDLPRCTIVALPVLSVLTALKPIARLEFAFLR